MVAVRDQGKDVIEHDIIKEPLSQARLKALLKQAGVKPVEALRKRDKMFKGLSFDTKPPTDAAALKAMAEHPGLIQRPIVVTGKKAAILTKADDAVAFVS